MPEQLTFDLPAKPALGRDAFFVSPSNALAVQRLERWADWPGGKMVLCGPKGSGKSHLAHVWASEAGAIIHPASDVVEDRVGALATADFLVIEDADQIAGNPIAEAAMFHLYNALQASGARVLLTAGSAPARWGIQLPDLKSRLESLAIVALEEPDDALLSALLVKLFTDRQISVNPELIGYLTSRMPRSADAARTLVDDLDMAALKRKRPITRRLAAEVLDKTDGDKA